MYKIPRKFHLKINRKLFLKPDPQSRTRQHSQQLFGIYRWICR